MHWRAYWWGIEILSDNTEDEKLLKVIASKLDKHPIVTYVTYDYGHFETRYGAYQEDTPDAFILTFNR